MPIYEYQCTNCGHTLEAIQKIGDAPLTDCPQCQHASLTKLVSAASFRLKGGGWYETDFKQGNRKNLAGGSDTGNSGKSDGGDAAKPAESNAAKVDSPKAETKTDAKTNAKKSTADMGAKASKSGSPASNQG